MIVDLFAGIVLGFFGALFSLGPEMTFPAAGTTGGSVGTFAAQANHWIPLADVLAALGIGIAWSLALTLWHLVVWVYDRLPFKGT